MINNKKLIRPIIDLYNYLKLYRFYNLYKPQQVISKRKTIISMIDGRRIHGGLSDRFWGILATYKYCKENNLTFKLNYTSPYNIVDYLLPNKIDWRISPKEITYSLRNARPRYISKFSTDRNKVNKYLNKVLSAPFPQLHVYTNTRAFNDNEFHTLFYELFKLSPILENALRVHQEIIGKNYISITFRFQQLLGDFNEGKFPILKTEVEKETLIQRCLEMVKRLSHKKQTTILVTSDSSTFLERVKILENIVTIPGKVVHVDYKTDGDSNEVHLKSFIDLFMVAQAKEVYLANIRPLYRSAFPKTAALIGNKPYFEMDE